MNDLAAFIQSTPLVDSHEHLNSEQIFLNPGPDVLQDLFDNYVTADLAVAGATAEAIKRLIDKYDSDVEARLAGVQTAWARCRHTGYGEAVGLIARLVYGMEEITPEAVEAAAPRNRELKKPGGRRHLLRDIGNLDHVQVDNFSWQCPPDPAGADFFLYDLSWFGFSVGEVEERVYEETGVTVSDVASLRQGMAAIFERHAASAIAIKTQHAYRRTLLWRERSDAEVAPIIARKLAGEKLTHEDVLCLGDWGLARGVELATEHNLPVKIHTGYHAGHSSMPIDWLRAGLLCDLLRRYPEARFVLMHTAYPYSSEILALAKHYPNVYLDMCWAWSIDPLNAQQFVRRAIHTVPGHKLFLFGGDAFWPSASVAYAAQCRAYFTRALQAEVDEGLLSEPAAMALAERFMRGNQYECFDLGR